jgi:prepilin-type N-terminal cleavage/methylation domain-containing protein
MSAQRVRDRVPTTNASAGFTLIEVLVALFIFVLILGTIYTTLRACVDSLRRGQKSMETYQGVQTAMERVLTDLRRAVSPQSVWNNLPEFTEDPNAPADAEEDEQARRQREQNSILIRFKGSSDEATWVVEDSPPRGAKMFDMYTIAYRAAQGEACLYKEIRGSVLDLRLEQVRQERLDLAEAKKSETGERNRPRNETGFPASETSYSQDYSYLYTSSSTETVGDRILVANNIERIKFSYYDGSEWRASWDSEEYVDDVWVGKETAEPIFDEEGKEIAPPENEPREKLGLPDAVLVELKLSNGDVISGIAEIPARDFDLLIVGNDGLYGSREGGRVVQYNRKNNTSPRQGRSGSVDRFGAWDNDRIERTTGSDRWTSAGSSRRASNSSRRSDGWTTRRSSGGSSRLARNSRSSNRSSAWTKRTSNTGRSAAGRDSQWRTSD